MLPSSPAALLLALTLFATAADAAERAPLPSCEPVVHHIELAADATSEAHEVCMRPKLAANFFFDSEVARIELTGRQRFRVMEGDAGLALLLVGEFHDGERVPMVVYFKDGKAPESATFVLVVHPAQAERQVEVSRHPRTLDSYRQGEQQARAEARQCQEEKARLQAESSGQVGLTGLIATKLLGEEGVRAQDIRERIAQRPGATFDMGKFITYRAVGPKGRGRVAVEVELWSPPGAPPWTLMGAALVGAQQEVLGAPTVWPLESIPPGNSLRIVVEVEATEAESRGTFTLKLWGKEGGVVAFDGVTFP